MYKIILGLLITLKSFALAVPPKGDQIIESKGRAIRVTYIQMELLPKKMLVGDSIGATTKTSVLECKGTCAKLTGCLSMNIKRNTTYTNLLDCEFLDFDHYGIKKRHQLIDAPEVDFYVLKVCILYDSSKLALCGSRKR